MWNCIFIGHRHEKSNSAPSMMLSFRVHESQKPLLTFTYWSSVLVSALLHSRDQTCFITTSPELITVWTVESTNSYYVDSGALVEFQDLPDLFLESPELSLASFVSQAQDVPKTKHVSKFNGFVLTPLTSISLGLYIPESGGTLQGQWLKKVPDVVWSLLCLFFPIIYFQLVSNMYWKNS